MSRLISQSELARFLRVSREAVRKWIRSGRLPVQPRGQILWSDVLATMDFGDPVEYVPVPELAVEPPAPPKVRKARIFDLEDTEEL